MGLIYQNSIPIVPQDGPFQPSFTIGNEYEAVFTDGENILVMVLKLIGIGFWSFTIAKLIHAITVLGNPAAIAYQQDIDVQRMHVWNPSLQHALTSNTCTPPLLLVRFRPAAPAAALTEPCRPCRPCENGSPQAVNRFCAYNRLPTSLARELRRYMYNTREVHAQRSRSTIYGKLSPLLVAKVTKLLNRPIFDSAILRHALADFPAVDGERFVSAIVTSSTTAVFSPGDRPAGGRLYLITEGVAIHRLFQLLSVGDCWGDEDVLLGDMPRKVRETKCMTYLRVLMIDRTVFRALEDDFPEPYGKMRMYSIWKRARRILRFVVNRAQSYERANGHPPPLEFFLDECDKSRDIALRRQSVTDTDLPPQWNDPRVGGRGGVESANAAKSAIMLPPASAPASSDQASSTAQVASGVEGGTSCGETLTAVHTLGRLLVDTRRELGERQDALAANVAAVGEAARASHDAMLTLCKKVDEMSEALNGRTARQAPRTPDAYLRVQHGVQPSIAATATHRSVFGNGYSPPAAPGEPPSVWV